jgi:hypothetical protein
MDRSLHLYLASPGLWYYTFKTYRNATVKQVFGWVGQKKTPMKA